jgi:PAS domain S-box-containing protein
MSEAAAFDAPSAIALDKQGLHGRLLFSALFAGFSLLALPWPLVAAWIAAILVWEFGSAPLLARITALPADMALSIFAASNLVGSCVFALAPVMALATLTPIGVAIGATWFCGAFMNCFIYAGEHRKLLWATLAPSIGGSLVGPMLMHGPSLASVVISALILTSLIAAKSFSVDHQVLLRRLADKQGALADVERKLAVAVEASGDGLFESDLQARTSNVSAAWRTMLGYAADAPVSVNLTEYVHPDDLAALNVEYQAHFRGQTPHTTSELRLRCADGSYKWVLSRARLVSRTADGGPWCVVGTTVDIAVRKALEHQLESAVEVAEQANAAKDVFVANMSHEIRTPLNGVMGITGALARTELTPQQREMVGIVQSSAQVLERLLSDILDQSKLDAGEFELQTAPFDLREAIESASELLRARAFEKGVDFSVSYSDATEGLFEGDAVRLRQIVSNLAANAIKFTEVGAVHIAVDAHPAEAADQPVTVTITVSDTGIGFDAETGQRLFARFVQADGSISRRFGGTGLGLAISKALTQRMGGVITARSEPGAGSVFEVRLPLGRVSGDAGQLAAVVSVDEDDPLEALSGLRVLLAEDHPTNQRVVQLILDSVGVDLTIVGDGEAAIEAFEHAPFDLILMDMQMPRVDGLTATREIRRREAASARPPIPIAMLTANATDEHREMAAQAGATHHIAKPITPQSLFAGIAAAMSAERMPVPSPLRAAG